MCSITADRRNLRFSGRQLIFALVMFTLLASQASAAVYHTNEIIASNTTWAPGVHVVQGYVTVNDNAVLTLEPGVVVKFAANAYMNVIGTLNATGNSTDKIVFTSLRDDTYGGDTNGDGNSSAPSPGDWQYINFDGYGANEGVGIFKNCVVRYGGAGAKYSMLYSYYSDSFTVEGCSVEHSSTSGFVSSYSSPVVSGSAFRNNNHSGIAAYYGAPLLQNNTFLDNGGYAAYLQSVAPTSYLNNTARGNGINAIGLRWVTVSSNLSLDSSITYAVLESMTVNDNAVLTLEPGVVVKFADNAYMNVLGTLN
ncbi:MAG: right-handed parallel beta-helix repeat-containing protein, partial [Euryarchaeota archaeon]|nr:right-handed parallel beta-helix repeat-containing protein [Euryarchaeota archaeon]